MRSLDLSRFANAFIAAVSVLSGTGAYASIIGILLVCGLGVPVPEDITLLAAGLIASTGQISLPGALIAGFFGVLLGDAILFFLGRRYGKRIFSLPGFRRIFTQDRIRIAEAKIKRNGLFICFIARFLPGLRSPTFAMAGAMGVRPIVFFSLDGFAALISVPVWVCLGYWFGSNWDQALAHAERAQGWVFAGVASLISVYVLYRFWRRRYLRKE